MRMIRHMIEDIWKLHFWMRILMRNRIEPQYFFVIECRVGLCEISYRKMTTNKQKLVFDHLL